MAALFTVPRVGFYHQQNIATMDTSYIAITTHEPDEEKHFCENILLLHMLIEIGLKAQLSLEKARLRRQAIDHLRHLLTFVVLIAQKKSRACLLVPETRHRLI